MNEFEEILIEIHKIPEEGMSLEGKLQADAVSGPIEQRLFFEKPLYYQLKVSLLGSKLLIEGKADLLVTGVCDRCLGKFDVKVSHHQICHYIEEIKEDRVDLTDAIREDMLLEVPMKLICIDDCKGLCADCGLNLNNHSCDCAKDRKEPSVWDDLDGLNL